MIEVRLIKPAKGQTIRYPATVIERDERRDRKSVV